MDGATQLTMAAWMRRAVPNGPLQVCKEPVPWVVERTCISYNADERVFFNVNNGVNSNADSRNSNLPNDTNWHHIVMVFNGNGATDADKVKGYFDGSPISDLFFFNSMPSTTAFNSAHLWIGAEDGFNDVGWIDEVRIYNRAISPDEVKRLYRIGATLHVNTANVGNNDTLKKGLVGYWSFEDTTMAGTKVYDQSGQNNTGTLTNGPTRTIGKLGQALKFASASSQYVDIPSAVFTAAPFTICYWFDNLPGGDSIPFWVGTASPGTDYVQFEYSSSGIRFRAQDSGGGSNTDSTPGPADNTWNHVCGVAAASDDRKLYVNGQFISQSTVSKVPSGLSHTAIGANLNSPSFYSDANMDDVRVYNRALSPAEIKRLYNLGGTMHVNTSNVGNNDTLKNGLVGYWSFEDTTMAGTKVYDQSGQGNDGVLIGAPIDAIGKIGQGMRFNGVNQSIRVGNSSSLAPANDMTIAGWVYFNVLPSGMGHGGLILQRNYSGGACACSYSLGNQLARQYFSHILDK